MVTSGPASTPEWAAFAVELGHRLRRARAEAGLTQEQLVERAGISLYAYQQYERGAVTKNGAATNPRIATLLAIAEALNVEISDVLATPPCFRSR